MKKYRFTIYVANSGKFFAGEGDRIEVQNREHRMLEATIWVKEPLEYD